MRFSDLMDLNADEAGNIVIDDLIANLPNTPLDVLEQLYVDHGRKYEFQEQYSDIDISNLEWSLVDLNYNEIAHASIFTDFQSWSNICAQKSQRVAAENDWKLIGHNKPTVYHWQKNRTWLRLKIRLPQGTCEFGSYFTKQISSDMVGRERMIYCYMLLKAIPKQQAAGLKR